MVSSEFPPESAGIGSYVYNLSKTLLEKGISVTVITKKVPVSSSNMIGHSINGINLVRLPLLPVYPLHLWVYGYFVNRVLERSKDRFSLVHLNSPASPPIRTALPIITTVHSTMRTDAKYFEIKNPYSLADKVQSSFFYPFSENAIFRSSSKICSVSTAVAAELRGYGIDPRTIENVGNGVDESVYKPIKNKKISNRYVLYTGRLSARKGLFDLINCAERVLSKHPDIKFLIAGKGNLLDKLVRIVDNMGLKNRIIFLGYVDKARFIDLYQNATIHVVPSHYEGLPTVLLEAMACGVPVVATDIGGNNEVITSGVNGFLVPSKSPEKLASAIELLLNDSALRSEIGSAARATIEKRYTWSRVCDRVIKCYEEVLAKKE